jgi:hypothetical protein
LRSQHLAQLFSPLILLILLLGISIAQAQISVLEPPKMDEIKAKKYLSIVFASQTPQSAISLFGHTFLVAHDESFPEVDSPVIEYLGVTQGHGSRYLQALLTEIPGQYVLSRFYLKLREYGWEGRDLWIYPLTLSEENHRAVLTRLHSHLDQSNNTYTFLYRNCSYYILKLLIGGEKAFSNPIYTLPRSTLLQLKAEGVIGQEAIYLPSERSRLIRDFNRLNSQERAMVGQHIDGQDTARLPAPDSDPHSVLQKALSFHIPRETDAIKRHGFYQTKKRLSLLAHKSPSDPKDSHLLNTKKGPDPLEQYGDSSLRMGYQSNTQSPFLEGKLVQRDAFTNEDDDLSGSYLELVKPRISLQEQGPRLDKFTLFKMDSLIPSHRFREPFNRLIDISYNRWQSPERKEFEEAYLRFGMGLSQEFRGLRMGVLPFVGARRFYLPTTNGFELDLGVMARANLWLGSHLFMDVASYGFIDSALPSPFYHDIKLLYRLTPQWSVGLQYQNFSPVEIFDLSVIIAF